MRTPVHLAPSPTEVPAEPVDSVVPELMPPPADRRELGYTPFSGFITYHFASAAIIHRGIFTAIEERLRSRFPTIGIEGTDVHVSFALEDNSDESRTRVDRVARKLHELMPNSALGTVTVGCAQYDRPRRGRPRLVDVSLESIDEPTR